eukprot:m.63977 g.63977  ORF g.63977 m.63977 type:complete len:52 (+) comp11979_c0_seq8:1138-1293(+)
MWCLVKHQLSRSHADSNVDTMSLAEQPSFPAYDWTQFVFLGIPCLIKGMQS